MTLETGSVAILTFKEGKFSSINTVQNKKQGYFLHAAQCLNNEGSIILEQECKNDRSCAKISTLTKSHEQNTYEASGDRGMITKSWAFCDADEPDAYQLIVRSKDGAVVSLTPLGNIMWQREEGLASIKAVQLIRYDFKQVNKLIEIKSVPVSMHKIDYTLAQCH